MGSDTEVLTPLSEKQSYTADKVAHAPRAELVDMFALCIKTKKLHWHALGLHFGDCHFTQVRSSL
jgi:DNA-binding ferritin-like protein